MVKSLLSTKVYRKILLGSQQFTDGCLILRRDEMMQIKPEATDHPHPLERIINLIHALIEEDDN